MFRRIVLAVTALVVGIYGILEFQRPAAPHPPTPTPVMAPVMINALPWARVRLRPVSKQFQMPSLSSEQLITPCTLLLPAGDYIVNLSNSGISPSQEKKIRVRAGQPNTFVVTMQDYDPAAIAAKAQKQ